MRFSELVFRPIGPDWPSERPRLREWEQRRSQFSAKWSRTIKDLELELRALDASKGTIQVDVEERHIRLDGGLRADARPSSSAVIISFDSKHGPVRMACDEFHSWHDNVRAIALSLNALRAVDRYGVTKRGEQYQGWKALPETTGHSFSELERLIEDAGGIRRALARYHPDNAETGNAELFMAISEYRDRVKEPLVV